MVVVRQLKGLVKKQLGVKSGEKMFPKLFDELLGLPPMRNEEHEISLMSKKS